MGALTPCKTCRSWNQAKDRKTGAAILNDHGQAQGECHRNPPSVTFLNSPQGLQIRSQFPITHGNMWCDEYLPIDSVQQ